MIDFLQTAVYVSFLVLIVITIAICIGIVIKAGISTLRGGDAKDTNAP